MVLLVELLHVVRSDDARAALGRVLLDDLLQLLDDDIADLRLGFDDFLQLFNLVFECFGLLRALQDILLVDVAQADIRNKFGLDFVDAEAFHQIRDNICVLFGLADDFNRLVDIEQDFAQTEQQMQLVLLLVEVEEHAAANAFGAPRRPLIEQLGYAEHARHACNQHVEVAGEAVLQGSHLHQLGHQLFRVGAALEVNGDLQTGKIGLVAHIGNLAHLAVLDQLGDLVDDSSMVVVYGISVISIRLSFLLYAHFARTLNEPRPVR